METGVGEGSKYQTVVTVQSYVGQKVGENLVTRWRLWVWGQVFSKEFGEDFEDQLLGAREVGDKESREMVLELVSCEGFVEEPGFGSR